MHNVVLFVNVGRTTFSGEMTADFFIKLFDSVIYINTIGLPRFEMHLKGLKKGPRIHQNPTSIDINGRTKTNRIQKSAN